MNLEYDYLIKTLLIGSSNVGKTSIMTQFADHKFNNDTVNTIGIDLKIKTIFWGKIHISSALSHSANVNNININSFGDIHYFQLFYRKEIIS